MTDNQTFELGKKRPQWTEHLHRELKRAQRLEVDIAAEIEKATGPTGGKTTGKTTAVSRFVQGDPAELRKWFRDRPEWIEILVRGTALTATDLRARLGAAPGVPWHPGFPNLTLEQVEIPVPLVGTPTTAQKWVEGWLSRLGSADRWSSVRPEPVVVVGGAGPSRDLAAAQVQRAMEAALAEKDLAGKVRIVRGTGGEADPEAAIWRILVEDSARDRAALRLAPWGSEQARDLACRLATVVEDPKQRNSLSAFAALVGDTPQMVGQGLPPSVVIWLLASVAQQGCPTTVPDTRRRLIHGAWSRAVQGSESLCDLDERFLDVVFARLATRDRDEAEPGGWTTVPETAVLTLIEGAIEGLYGRPDRRHLLELAEAVAARKSEKDRRQELEKLRLAVERRPAEDVLGELIAGGVFERVGEAPSPSVRACQPSLAAVWAVRGLGKLPALAGQWTRLLDPDWGLIVEELARNGANVSAIAAVREDAAPELAADASLWVLRHAASAETVVSASVLVPAWAEVLWAVAHGLFGGRPWSPYNEWTRIAAQAVSMVSWKYRGKLPIFGNDVIGGVREHVSPAVLDFVAQWRRTPERGDPPTADTLSELRDCNALAEELRRFSPAQCVPDTPEKWRWWAGRLGGEVVLREHAERGNEGCQELLWSDRFLPARTRLTAAVRWGPRGPSGVHLLRTLSHELRGDRDSRAELIGLAVRLGREAVRGMAGVMLQDQQLGHGEEDGELWMEIAERLELVEELQTVCAPGWLDGAVLKFAAGFNLHLSEGRQVWIPRTEHEPHAWSGRMRIGVDVLIEGWERVAERAAVALWRLGHREPLRQRWLAAPTEPSGALMAQMARYEGLMALLDAAPRAWPGSVPLDTLAALAVADTPEPWLDADLRALGHQMKLWGRSFSALGEVGIDHVERRLADAVRGAWAMLKVPLDEWDPELGAFFEAQGAPFRYFLDDRSAHTAVERLLDLGDDAPLQGWCTGQDPVAAARVDARLRSDDVLLSRAWAALIANDSPDLELRKRLLVYGSAGAARKVPLPFVVNEALVTADSATRDWLGWVNDRSREWTPVLRDAFVRAPDRRSAAYAAVRLLRLNRDHRDAKGEVRWWLEQDPTPFAGGRYWHREAPRWLGGAADLLAAALEIREEWSRAGLVRLWEIALALPLSDSTEHDDTDEPAPESASLYPIGAMAPWPLCELADGLEARGLVDPLLAAWRGARHGPSDERFRSLQAWLGSYWLRHAPVDEILRELPTPTLWASAGLEELRRRGVSADLLPLASRLAAQGDSWLLARVAPAQQLGHLETRLAASQNRREELADAFDSASREGSVHPPTLLAIRRMLLTAVDDQS